jgi:3-oxoacyl-[acyl-carrier protein] reductase
MVDGVMAKWGRIDTLVNNAGIVQDAQFKKMSEGPVRPRHRRQPEGRLQLHEGGRRHHAGPEFGCILNASSIVGIYGNFGQTNYAATKFGVIGMVKTWARELGSKGIRANAICPGYINTPILASMPAKVLKMIEDKVPMGHGSASPRKSRTLRVARVRRERRTINGCG